MSFQGTVFLFKNYMMPNIVKVQHFRKVRKPIFELLIIHVTIITKCSITCNNLVHHSFLSRWTTLIYQNFILLTSIVTSDFKLILSPSWNMVTVEKEPWKTKISVGICFYIPHVFDIFIAYIMEILNQILEILFFQ